MISICKIFCFSAFLLFFADIASTAGIVINFERPAVPGRVSDFFLSGTFSESVEIRNESGEKEAGRVDTLKLELRGRLKVLSISPEGLPSKLEFKVERLAGNFSGVDYISGLSGHELTVDKTLSPVGISVKRAGATPSRKDLRLLRLVFVPLEDMNLKDFIGTGREVSPGDSWKPSLKPFYRLAGKGKKKFKALVRYEGKKNFRGIECFVLKQLVKSRGSPDNVIEFSGEIFLPSEKKDVGPVKVSSNLIESFTQKLSGDNPLTAGKVIYFRRKRVVISEILPSGEGT